MAFRDLSADELQAVADFFVVDVTQAGEKANKKELIAALSAGDDPVTWDQYSDIYLPAKSEAEAKAAIAAAEPVTEDVSQEGTKPVSVKSKWDTEDKSDWVLIKYERKNPTWEALGFTFTTRHPYATVPPEVAEFLVIKQEGFRLALPSELNDYYN